MREVFDGQVAYSANWDRFDKVALWPLVDVMSVSSYFELRRDDDTWVLRCGRREVPADADKVRTYLARFSAITAQDVNLTDAAQREAVVKADQDARELRLDPGVDEPSLPDLSQVKRPHISTEF